MRNSLKAAVLSAFSVMLLAGLYTETRQHGEINATGDVSVQQIVKGTGVVKDVDLSSERITISHEATLAIGWPAMTIRFTFVNADDNITALKVGTHVGFTLVQQDNISLLRSISDTQS